MGNQMDFFIFLSSTPLAFDIHKISQHSMDHWPALIKHLFCSDEIKIHFKMFIINYNSRQYLGEIEIRVQHIEGGSQG